MDAAAESELAALRSHHLFAGLSPEQYQRLQGASRIDAYDAGQILFDRGQPAQSFFIVVDGQVNLVLYSRAGEHKIVDILGPGQSFAEAVMFMEAPGYPVAAVAGTDARVARFASREYLAILRESPETCLRMLGQLSLRLHMRIREIEQLTLESATHRLIFLLQSRLPAGQDGQGGSGVVTLLESRQELASRLSMKPETLSRILRHLADAGVLEIEGRELRIPDRRRLSALLD
jgi:CRP-like cAMP-binding protein